MIRPNFNENAMREGDDLVLTGQSPRELGTDIVAVSVVLTQGKTIAQPVFVENPGAGWSVKVPAADFEAGAAVAFGIETHSAHATTITWSDVVQLPKAPS